MSRAFVKEIDDAEVPVPERLVSAAPNRVTARGALLIEQEIEQLEQRLAAGGQAGRQPEPEGEDPRILRRDLRYWQARHATMELMQPDEDPDAIGFGTSVRIGRSGREQELTIVGEDEAHPASGLIAWTSPLARALEGAQVGDAIELHAAGRDETVTVLAVTARDNTQT